MFSCHSECIAVKLQSKAKIIAGKTQQHLLNEINIMGVINFPLIMDMKSVAQDEKLVYIYLEFVKYGNLMKVMNTFTKLDRSKAEFYAAQVVLCLEYIHN